MDLKATSIEVLPGTSALTFKKLKSLGIETLWDFLLYVPFRYEDYRRVVPIRNVEVGETLTIEGTVHTITKVHTRSRVTMVKAVIHDSSGSIDVTWFNQPYLVNILKPGMLVSIAGVGKQFGNKMTLEPKEYEIITDNDQPRRHTAKLIPVYPAKYGVSTHLIREKLSLVFEKYVTPEALELLEYLPKDFVAKYKLASEGDSYQNIHFPGEQKLLDNARYRLGFDELFLIQLSSLLVRKQWEEQKVSYPFDVTSTKNKQKIEHFIETLPFKLTNGQKKVLDDIMTDLKGKRPMNRFVQGDVGSGKRFFNFIQPLYISFFVYLH